jgi:signal transduction histidine kinase
VTAPRRHRPATLRVRITVVAALALTAAVTIGTVVVYLLQLDSVHRTIQDGLHEYASQIEQSATAGGAFPNPLPPSNRDPAAAAQVLTADGRVLAASPTLRGRPAIYILPAGSRTPVRQKAADLVVDRAVAVYGRHVTLGGRSVSIITGSANEQLRQQVQRTFTWLLFVGLPAMLLLACATVWLVVGRALRPVERIRRAVTDITDISAAGLTQRVPETGTDDEIGHLAQTMNAMLARLEDSAGRQRRFVADASHELRSPLTAIRGGLEVGLAHPDRAPWPNIAERTVKQATRLEALINDLLLLAKSDGGKAATRHQHVRLAPLLAELKATTATPRITIELDASPDVAVTGNPADLSRVFRNVVDNAVRYARSTVRIRASGADGMVRVDIADDGPGIPAEERERAFDRFARLDASREHASGSTGLGLAIAREIVTAHHGAITISGPDHGGALVTVLLPGSTPPPPGPSNPPGCVAEGARQIPRSPA